MSIIPLRDRAREHYSCNPVVDDVSLRNGTSRGVLQPARAPMPIYERYGRDTARCVRGSEVTVGEGWRDVYRRRAEANARSQMDRACVNTAAYDASVDRAYTEHPRGDRTVGEMAHRHVYAPTGRRNDWGGNAAHERAWGGVREHRARDLANTKDRTVGRETLSFRNDWGGRAEHASLPGIHEDAGRHRDPCYRSRESYQTRSWASGTVQNGYGAFVATYTGSERDRERGNAGVRVNMAARNGAL